MAAALRGPWTEEVPVCAPCAEAFQRERRWSVSESFFWMTAMVCLFLCFTVEPTLRFWSKPHLFVVHYSFTGFLCGGANSLTFCYGVFCINVY